MLGRAVPLRANVTKRSNSARIARNAEVAWKPSEVPSGYVASRQRVGWSP